MQPHRRQIFLRVARLYRLGSGRLYRKRELGLAVPRSSIALRPPGACYGRSSLVVSWHENIRVGPINLTRNYPLMKARPRRDPERFRAKTQKKAAGIAS